MSEMILEDEDKVGAVMRLQEKEIITKKFEEINIRSMVEFVGESQRKNGKDRTHQWNEDIQPLKEKIQVNEEENER